MEILPFLFWPFVASLILTGIHSYLGVHVVERGVIFVDLSLAQVLKSIWLEKLDTAAALRGRIEKVLDAAKSRGLRSGENPARRCPPG